MGAKWTNVLPSVLPLILQIIVWKYTSYVNNSKDSGDTVNVEDDIQTQKQTDVELDSFF